MLMREARWPITLLPAVEKAVFYSFPSICIDCSCALSVSGLEPQQALLRAGGRASLLRKEGGLHRRSYPSGVFVLLKHMYLL